MQMIDGVPHSYIGDGVYAIFDGYGIWLRTGDHREQLCSNQIYLEPSVYKELIDFKRHIEEVFKINQEE